MTIEYFDVIRFNIVHTVNGRPRLSLRSKNKTLLMPLRKRIEEWLFKVSKYSTYPIGVKQDNENKALFYTPVILCQRVDGVLMDIPDTTICKLIHHLINVGCVLESNLCEKVYVPDEMLPGTAHDIPEVVVETEPEPTPEVDYSGMTVKQLKSLCRERGIKTTNLRKTELSAALQYAEL